jgi:hypothetical protein
MKIPNDLEVEIRNDKSQENKSQENKSQENNRQKTV